MFFPKKSVEATLQVVYDKRLLDKDETAEDLKIYYQIFVPNRNAEIGKNER